MRTIEEITTDGWAAISAADTEALERLSSELDLIGTDAATAQSLNLRGLADSYNGAYSQALEKYGRSLGLYKELGNRHGFATVTGNIGVVYDFMGDYPSAIEHAREALGTFKEIGDRLGMANSMVNIGSALAYTGDYPGAMEYFRGALDKFDEVGNRVGAVAATMNIGVIHTSIGEYEAALECYEKAREQFTALGNRKGVAGALQNIGNIHLAKDELSASLEYYNLALEISKEIGDENGATDATAVQIAPLVELGFEAEATELLSKMGQNVQSPHVNILMEFARAKLQERRQDPEAAKVSLQTALQIAQQQGLRRQESEAFKYLRDLAQSQGDFAGYIENNDKYTKISEEITGKEATLKLGMQLKQREIDAREREVEKHMAILHSTLPKHIADRVARGETVNDHHENAAVIFADIVGFTTHSSEMDSSDVTRLLADVFERFDSICDEHDVTKIKTIGDSYLAVSFQNSELRTQNSELEAASVALAMMASSITWPDGSPLQFRIGIHSGPVTAGVIGTHRMQYDVWGDTVNVASRMESTGEPGRIQVSEKYARELGTRHTALGTLRERGTMEVKGKGQMKTFWLEGATT